MYFENKLSRRSFLAGSAALIAGAALAGSSALAAESAEKDAAASAKADSAKADSAKAESAATHTLADLEPLEEETTLTFAASPSPHAVILDYVKDAAKELKLIIDVTEFTDYVQPNNVVESGEFDANYFQHLPYLVNFNQENGTHVKAVVNVHFEAMAIFGGKTTDLADVPDGATVAVPNDTTNEARALLLLQAQGLIKLKDGAGLEATPNDIAENPKNLKFSEVEAAAVPRTLADCDLGVANGNYALDAGLKFADALAAESPDSEAATTYANVVAVKEDRVDEPAIKLIADILTAQETQEWINEYFAGAVVAVNIPVQGDGETKLS